MAHNADIQYVHHVYTSGTAARKLNRKAAPKAPIPKFEPGTLEEDQKITVPVDPLSLVTILIAVVLLVTMVVDLLHCGAAYRENVALQEYVYELRNENAQLEQIYRASFDLGKIESQAIALGMVPIEEVEILQISGRVPAEAVEPTRWENMQLLFRELFADVR